jgi:hypothetical protein
MYGRTKSKEMKIQLPNGEKINLDENLSLEEKNEIVQNLVESHYPTRTNWDSNSTRFFLDGLANYLVWHKDSENKNKQDKDVLSIKRVEEMEGKRKARSIPFSSLSEIQREELGFEGDSN